MSALTDSQRNVKKALQFCLYVCPDSFQVGSHMIDIRLRFFPTIDGMCSSVISIADLTSVAQPINSVYRTHGIHKN